MTREALLHQGVVGVAVDRRLVSELFGVPESTLRERFTGLAELGVAHDPPLVLGSRLLQTLELAAARLAVG